MLFWTKHSPMKRRYETVLCREATVSSFVAKFRGEVFTYFHIVAVINRSSIPN
jgi:hypothetical protein